MQKSVVRKLLEFYLKSCILLAKMWKGKHMRVIYIADDGKEFDNEFDCEHHEWMLNHQNLQYIKIYNEDGELFEDVLSDDAYNYSRKVVVPTDLAAKELQDWAVYSGFCYFEHITESGVWEYEEVGHDGRFVKVGEFNG